MKKLTCGIFVTLPALIITCICAWGMSMDGAPVNLLVVYGLCSSMILVYGGWLASSMIVGDEK